MNLPLNFLAKSLIHFLRQIALFAAFITSLSVGASTGQTQKELTVYTHRNEQLIKPLFDLYQKEKGIKVNFLTGEPGALFERIKAEGKNTKADLFISVDAGSLWQADREQLFEPLPSEVLVKNIPAHLRAPTNTWFGLSLRARSIVYNKNKVQPSELKDYTDLANKKWQGRLCLRTSKKVYNQSLVAMMIAESNEDAVEKTVEGWIKNLKKDVFDNDTKLIEAIDAGECDVGIANSYYLGRLQKEKKAQNVRIFYPSKTHINISGGGVLKNSKNKTEAQKFLEWLTSDKAQKLFADSNLEYPVVKNIQPDEIIKSWPPLTPSETPLIKAGELQRRAMIIIDRARYR